MRNTGKIRALHVHDAANVGKNLVDKANELGYAWSQTAIPWYYTRQWTGVLKHPAVRLKPVVWDGSLALQATRYDVVHVHTGGLGTHMRWVRKPWVLHLHGTDIRTRQYMPSWKARIEYGMTCASAVVYATPDLAEHARKLRDDAVYLPITVRLDQAPEWNPTPGRVIFASRWDEVKGLGKQVEVAKLLRATRPDIEILGLDWGTGAVEARAAGVTLVPKMPYEEYKTWLATASVVVGQMTDVLATSELEALASGVPVVSSASHSYYPSLNHLSSTGAPSVAEAVLRAVEDPKSASRAQNGQQFIAEYHDAGAGVTALLELYSSLSNER